MMDFICFVPISAAKGAKKYQKDACAFLLKRYTFLVSLLYIMFLSSWNVHSLF